MRISTLLLLSAWFCDTLHATIQNNGPAASRVVVEEGRDAILHCSLNTGENIEQAVFDWKKDDQKEVFFYRAGDHYNNRLDGQDEQFKGRVFHFQDELKHGDASIIINNTKVSDSGNYTCDFPLLQPNGQKFYVELVVDPIDKDRSGVIRGAARRPYITTEVTEAGLLLLKCEVQDASPKPEVEWQDSAGNILHAEEPQVINRGDRYNVTLLIIVTKTDYFRCVVKQKEIHHEISAQTYVSVPGAAREPCPKILGVTKDGVLLQCKVHGASPKPEVEWQDSDGNVLPADEPQVTERGGSYDIILLTTVTKSDNVSCVVRQKEIHHEISDWTYVSVPGAAPKPCPKILGVTKDGGVLLQCEVHGASPKPEVEWQDSDGNVLPADEPQVTERGGSYDIILLTTVTKSDNVSCVVRQKGIDHEISDWTYVSVPEKRRVDWAGWVFGVLFFGALILAALLVATKCITITLNKGSPPQTNDSSTRYSQVPPQPESHQNGHGSPPQRNSSCNGSTQVPLEIPDP